VWKDLKGDSRKVITSELIQEFNSIKQGKRRFTNYYSNLKIVWEELDSLGTVSTYVYSIK